MKKFVAAAAFALVGCGSDPAKLGAGGDSGSGEVVEAQQQDDDVFYVQAGAELPPCDRENKLIYVQAESTFKICAAGAWANIDLRGPAGTDNRIVKSIFCGGDLADSGWTASYSAAETASGDVFVSASVGGTLLETSKSVFYSSQQKGALTAAVSMRNDAEGSNNYGWWAMELDRTTLVLTATYSDIDAPGGKRVWTMTPDKCVVNDYTTPPGAGLTSAAVLP